MPRAVMLEVYTRETVVALQLSVGSRDVSNHRICLNPEIIN